MPPSLLLISIREEFIEETRGSSLFSLNILLLPRLNSALSLRPIAKTFVLGILPRRVLRIHQRATCIPPPLDMKIHLFFLVIWLFAFFS